MSVTALHVPYKKELEPVVRVGENVAIAKGLDEDKWEFYRVKYIEPIHITYTTSSISAGEEEDVEVTDLELGRNELGHIRVLVQTDNFSVTVKLPEALPRLTTKDTYGKVTKWLSDNYPHLTEVFYLADSEPKFTVKNDGTSAATCTIYFVGFRYILEKLTERPKEFTVVYVTTVVSGTLGVK